jgi:hypothetical protein
LELNRSGVDVADYNAFHWQLATGGTVAILLSSDLENPDAVPYFLWDEPMTVSELQRRLATASAPEHIRLIGKILREARDTDVWKFTSPREVRRHRVEISKHLGRRRPFWEFLLARWEKEGLLGKQ